MIRAEPVLRQSPIYLLRFVEQARRHKKITLNEIRQLGVPLAGLYYIYTYACSAHCRYRDAPILGEEMSAFEEPIFGKSGRIGCLILFFLNPVLNSVDLLDDSFL